MQRRAFIKYAGVTGTAVAVASPALIVGAITAKPKRDPLPKLQAGEVVTESFFGELVDRVNELDAR